MRKKRKIRRKSRRKKRGGNEPNWLDVCDAKYNDVNYRYLTNRQADLYCRSKTRNRNSKCIDGECKFIENTRPRNDPSSIYDDDVVRIKDELRDGTADQRLEEEERQRQASLAVFKSTLGKHICITRCRNKLKKKHYYKFYE